MQRISAKRRNHLVAVMCSLGAVALLLAATGWREGESFFAHLANPLDRAALDAQARWQRDLSRWPVAVDPLVIGIDEDSIAAVPEPPALWHRSFGLLIDGISRAQPLAMGLDVALPERLYVDLLPGIDALLQKPVAQARDRLPLVFSASIDATGTPRLVHPAYVAVAGGTRHFGTPEFQTDADGRVRRFRHGDCASAPVDCTFTGVLAAELGVPRTWSGYIPYALGENIPYLPMQQVLLWIAGGDSERLLETFRGRIVLIGKVAPQAERVAIPVALADREPAATEVPRIYLHAQVLRAMLGGGFLSPAPAWQIVAIGLLGALCALGSGFVVRAALLAAYLLFVFVLTQLYFREGQVLPAGTFATGAIIALLIGTLVVTLDRWNTWRRLRHGFETVLDTALVNSIRSGETDIGARARHREVTVMVCHLDGLAERVRQTQPARLALWMDAVLARIERAVQGRGGRIESFAGDTLLISFGAPLPIRAHPRAALEAAQDIQLGLARLHHELGGSSPPVPSISVGIACDQAFVGRLGIPGRAHWHVIGGVIDQARALQIEARRIGVPVLCSEAVAAGMAYPANLRQTALDNGMRAYAWAPDVSLHAPGGARSGTSGRTAGAVATAVAAAAQGPR